MDSNQINDIVRQVLAEMNGAKPATPAAPAAWPWWGPRPGAWSRGPTALP